MALYRFDWLLGPNLIPGFGKDILIRKVVDQLRELLLVDDAIPILLVPHIDIRPVLLVKQLFEILTRNRRDAIPKRLV